MFEEDVLKQWSIRWNFGYSLRRTPRKLTEDELDKEISRLYVIYWALSPLIDAEITRYFVETSFGIKSPQSALLKVQRHPKTEMRTVFNDLLGFRVVAPYADSKSLDVPYLRKVDMREGKKHDDGYRGIHYYYEHSNQHYPIEIQWWNEHDKKLNHWLHENSYKFNEETRLARTIRELYDVGNITAEQFEEVYDDLRNS